MLFDFSLVSQYYYLINYLTESIVNISIRVYCVVDLERLNAFITYIWWAVIRGRWQPSFREAF